MYKITYENVISIARTEEELFDRLVRRLCFLHPDYRKEYIDNTAYAVVMYFVERDGKGSFVDTDFRVEKGAS